MEVFREEEREETGGEEAEEHVPSSGFEDFCQKASEGEEAECLSRMEHQRRRDPPPFRHFHGHPSSGKIAQHQVIYHSAIIT